MVHQTKHVSMGDLKEAPAWERLIEEVRATQESQIIQTENGEDIAIITPAKRSKRTRRGKPTSADDPFWRLTGIGRSDGPGDISENKTKYLVKALKERLRLDTAFSFDRDFIQYGFQILRP